jgi:tetratricopeptide (TPR) repeat protein
MIKEERFLRVGKYAMVRRGRTVAMTMRENFTAHNPSSPELHTLSVGAADLIRIEVTSLLDEATVNGLCMSANRFWLQGAELGLSLLGRLKERISSLPPAATLVLDFRRAAPDQEFLFPILKGLYFPDHYDGTLTRRFVSGRRVLIANPGSATLLGIAQTLELARAQCVVITDTETAPWEMLYAGHIEPRLEKMLQTIHAKGTVTVQSLVEENVADEVDRKKKDRIIRNFAGILKDLYDFGLIHRQKVTVSGGRGQRLSFQYTLYHPSQHLLPDYVPPSLFFYRMPRPPRTGDAPESLAALTAEEEPEPDSELRWDRLLRGPRRLREALQNRRSSVEANRALERAVHLWRFWDDARQYLTREEKHKAYHVILEIVTECEQRDGYGAEVSAVAAARLQYSLACLVSAERGDTMAETHLERACALAVQANDVRLLCHAELNLGIQWAARGRHFEALTLYAASQHKAQTLPDPAAAMKALLCLGNLYADRNDAESVATAIGYFETCLVRGQHNADALPVARALDQMGRIYMNQGRNAEADDCFARALLLCRTYGYLHLEATVLVNVSALDWERENLRAIPRYLERAITILRRLDDPGAEAAALINLAASQTEIGETQRAAFHLERCLGLCRLRGDTVKLAYALDEVARLCRRHLDWENFTWLSGAADGLRAPITGGVTRVQQQPYEKTIQEAYGQLGRKRFLMLWERGEQSQVEEAASAALLLLARFAGSRLPDTRPAALS